MKNNYYSHAPKSKISNKLLLVLIIILMIPVFFVSKGLFTTNAQTNEKNEKRITKAVFNNEPIEFTELKSNAKKFKLGESFIQEDDWLKDFTVDVKNISGKPITYISFVISFPETQSTGLPMTWFISYGVPPNIPQSDNSQSKLLAPNEIVQMGLTPDKYTKLTNFLATRNHTFKDLTQAHITIMAVYFEDGTKWSSGSMYRKDLDRPGKYIPIDSKKS